MAVAGRGTSSPGSATMASKPRTGTRVPSATMMWTRIPEAVDSSSVWILAVSTSTIGSPSSTISPSCFSHLTMVPSCISIPHWGSTISVAMTFLLGLAAGPEALLPSRDYSRVVRTASAMVSAVG